MKRPILFFVACLLALPGPASQAEDAPSGLSNVLLRGLDRGQYILRQADALAKAGDFHRAIPLYQKVLDEYADSLHPFGPDLVQSAGAYARRRLASLGEKARKIYQDFYAETARTMALRKADTGRAEALLALGRRYPLAPAGLLSLATLGRDYVRSGNDEKAVQYYQELFRFAGTDLGPWTGDLVLLAVAYARLGRVWPKDGVLTRAARTFADAPVHHSGRQRRLADVLADVKKRIRPNARPAQPSGWPCFGGNPAGDRTAEGSFLDPTFQKAHDLPALPMFVKSGGYSGFGRYNPFQNAESSLRLSFRPFQPVMRGGVVYVHNGITFLALNALDDWNLVWRYRSPYKDKDFNEMFEPNAVYSATLHQGILYAVMAVPPLSPESKMWSSYTVIQDIPLRRLVALDADTGDLLWSAGGRKHPVTRTDRLSFFTAPVVVDGDLYIAGRHVTGSVTHYIAKLDARTGATRWLSHVCSGQQELNMFGRIIRESFGSTVAYRDGALFYCSNLGVMVSVNADDGVRRWIARYTRVERTLQPHIPLTYKNRPQWYPNPVVATADRVIFTPLDSPFLYALDPGTGATVWVQHRKGSVGGPLSGQFYLLGVSQGKAVISGSHVEAVDIKTGKLVWRRPIGDPSSFAGRGRGLLTDRYAYIPTYEYINILDINAGGIVARHPWPRCDDAECYPGNLIMADGVLISASRKKISSFFDLERILRDLLARIKRDPGNPDLHLRAAAVCRRIRRPRWEEAVLHYTRVRKITAKDPRYEAVVKKGLYDCFREEAEVRWSEFRFSRALELFQKALAEAPGAADTIRVRLRLLDFYKKKSNPRGVEAQYTKIMTRHDTDLYTFVKGAEAVPAGLWARFHLADLHSRHRRLRPAIELFQQIIARFSDVKYRPSLREIAVPARRLATTRIEAILKKAGRSIYEKYDTQAQALYDGGLKRRDVALFRKAVEHYPNARVHDRCVVALADLLLKQGEIEEAQETLRVFQQTRSSSPEMAQALTILVRAWEAKRRFGAAKRILEKLRDIYGKSRIQTAEGQAFAVDWARGRLAKEEYRKISIPPKAMEIAWPHAWNWTRRIIKPGAPSNRYTLKTPKGACPPAARDYFFLWQSRPRTLTCASARKSYKDVWQAHLPEVATSLQSLLYGSSTLVVVTNQRLWGLDLSTGKVLWKRAFRSLARVKGASVHEDVIAVNVSSLFDYDSTALLCIDAITGRDSFGPIRFRGTLSSMGAPRFGPSGLVTFSKVRRATLASVDPVTGKALFSYRVPLNFTSAPELLDTGDIAYVTDRTLVLVNGKTGRVTWRHPLGKVHPDTMRTNGTFIAEISDPSRRTTFLPTGKLLLLDPSEKNRKWEVQLNRARGYEIMAVTSEHVYLLERELSGRSPSTVLCAYAVADGRLAWKIYLLNSDTPRVRLVVGKSRGLVQVSASSNRGRIKGFYILFDRKTGLMKKKMDFTNRFRYPPSFTVVNGTLIYALNESIVAHGG
jgi:outer membrane protein assembly factor BamB